MDQPDPTVFADFHFHSRYSRAVSREMDLEGLAEGANAKGLGIIGTGDFSHPKWLAEIKGKLEESGDSEGLYRLRAKPNSPLYTLTNEVATFFSGPNGLKKVHHVIHAPSFEVVAQLNDIYSKMGNLAADGRPMFGKTSPADFLEKTMSVSREIIVYPAHAWTPWFGALGSKGGFESLEDCYEDQVKHIHALETGMSSDPAMNWRVSTLDKFTLLSNSDAHSNHPWRLGRECNAFSFGARSPSYKSIHDAIAGKDNDTLLYTVETSPAYGKYHYDGHRDCSFSCSPAESRKIKGKCPVCKKPLTIGVENRVEELADRPAGFVPINVIPFKTVLPLHELLSCVLGSPLASRKVTEEGQRILAAFPSELDVLLNATESQLLKHSSHPQIVWAIMLNRQGKIEVLPGFDGVYGVPELPASMVLKKNGERAGEKVPRGKELPQKDLGEFGA